MKKTMTISINKDSEVLYESKPVSAFQLLLGYDKIIDEMTKENPEMDNLIFTKEHTMNLNTYCNGKLESTKVIR